MCTAPCNYVCMVHTAMPEPVRGAGTRAIGAARRQSITGPWRKTEALLRRTNMVAGGRLAGDRGNYHRTQQPSALAKGFS